MEKVISIFLISVIFLTVNGQELMTIGEVFDFEVGDEFQIDMKKSTFLLVITALTMQISAQEFAPIGAI